MLMHKPFDSFTESLSSGVECFCHIIKVKKYHVSKLLSCQACHLKTINIQQDI